MQRRSLIKHLGGLLVMPSLALQKREPVLRVAPADVPVLVMSHIPILTATQLVADDIVNKWELLGGDMHTDVEKIVELFYRFPNVKLCLSGAWWEGRFDEAYVKY